MTSRDILITAGPFKRFLTRVAKCTRVINVSRVRGVVMCIFLFLRFYDFIKGIARIYLVFLKKLRPLFLYLTKNWFKYF